MISYNTNEAYKYKTFVESKMIKALTNCAQDFTNFRTCSYGYI